MTVALDKRQKNRQQDQDRVRSHCELPSFRSHSLPYLGGTLSRSENSSKEMAAIWVNAGRYLGVRRPLWPERRT